MIGEKGHTLRIIALTKMKLEYSLNEHRQTITIKEKELFIGSSLTCDIIDPTFAEV
jgi:hypothetical protein